MGLFNRKKEKEKEKENIVYSLPHQHVWKDMPWYMEEEYNGDERTASYSIIEPYICLTCGERKNVTLEHTNWSRIDNVTRDQYYEAIKEKYKKYLRPRAIVEDMINNIIYVKDPGRLEMLEKLWGTPHRNVGSSSRYRVTKEPYEFQIKVDGRNEDT